jgi:hypothetical protein
MQVIIYVVGKRVTTDCGRVTFDDDGVFYCGQTNVEFCCLRAPDVSLVFRQHCGNVPCNLVFSTSMEKPKSARFFGIRTLYMN